MGVAAAAILSDVSEPIDNKPSSASDCRVKTVTATDNVFVSHRKSPLVQSIDTDATKVTKRDASISVSFDDEVERLLEHGW